MLDDDVRAFPYLFQSNNIAVSSGVQPDATNEFLFLLMQNYQPAFAKIAILRPMFELEIFGMKITYLHGYISAVKGASENGSPKTSFSQKFFLIEFNLANFCFVAVFFENVFPRVQNHKEDHHYNNNRLQEFDVGDDINHSFNYLGCS